MAEDEITKISECNHAIMTHVDAQHNQLLQDDCLSDNWKNKPHYQAHIHTHMYKHVYIYIYIYMLYTCTTHTHTYIYIYIYIYMGWGVVFKTWKIQSKTYI